MLFTFVGGLYPWPFPWPTVQVQTNDDYTTSSTYMHMESQHLRIEINQACAEKYLFSARKKSYKVLRYFSFLRPEDLNKYTHLAVRKFLCKTQSASVLSFPQSHWELQTVRLLLCVNFYYFSMSTSLITSTIPSQSVYLISKAIS